MQQISDLERMFYDDVREKKRTASGVHSKTGKNGYVGNMRFPSDLMNRKEKMRYKRGSKIMISNMYDEILSIEEFEQLETSEKRNRMAYWRNEKTNKDILKGMGIASAKYYEIVQELGLPKAPRTYTKRRNKRKAPPIETSGEKTIVGENEKSGEKEKLGELKPNAPEDHVQQIIVNGLNLQYQGTCKSDEIMRQLEKFIALVDGETDDFYFELRLMQKQSK